jgi:hypothetical protein
MEELTSSPSSSETLIAKEISYQENPVPVKKRKLEIYT